MVKQELKRAGCQPLSGDMLLSEYWAHGLDDLTKYRFGFLCEQHIKLDLKPLQLSRIFKLAS
jgi:hypothetical protein